MVKRFAIIDSELNILFFDDQRNLIKIETLPPIISTSGVVSAFLLFLDQQGYVWISGSIPMLPYTEISHPLRIDGIKNICKISSGKNHCLLLDKNGDVFSFGTNMCGQLGYEGENPLSAKIELPFSAKIKEICCGDSFSILIDIDGNCFSFGNNSSGQLGLGNYIRMYVPTKINNLPPVVCASAGIEHTILIGENDKFYSFGDNSFSQLGFRSVDKNLFLPIGINLEGIQRIIKAYCFGYSTILQDANDNFWACGLNEYGELGIGNRNTVSILTKITAIKDIHSIIPSNDSNLFINKNGECFLCGKINGKTVPTKIEESIEALVLKPKRFNKTKNARNP